MGYCFLYKRGNGGSGGSNRPVVVKTALGSIISLTDSTNGKLRGLRIFGKTTQNGTPSPEAPVPLESVGDDGNVTVFVGKSQTDSNPQSATFDTPNGLPGIPVSSGGNYTDSNGQMWVCDEIDCDRGVRVQRFANVDLSTFSWRYAKSFWRCDNFAETIGAKIPRTAHLPIALCNTLAIMTWNDIASTDNAIAWMTGIALVANGSDTVPPTGMLYCELETPIETPLSAEELAQYAALHTNYPNTTIFNDEGADMEVKYTSGG